MSTLVHETITDLLARGAAVRFLVRGDSMHPVIRSGDYVTVEPTSADAIRRGDIVLSLTGRGLTAHRLIAIGRSALFTRGDNAAEVDEPFAIDRLIGRIVRIERNGRTVPLYGRGSVAVIRLLRSMRRIGGGMAIAGRVPRLPGFPAPEQPFHDRRSDNNGARSTFEPAPNAERT